LRGLFEQRDFVVALGSDRGGRKARGAAAYDRDALATHGLDVHQLRLPASPRVDDAARRLPCEVVIETSLVAGDTDVDRCAIAGLRLVRELRIRKQRARK
jgi:hypothetical protein